MLSDWKSNIIRASISMAWWSRGALLRKKVAHLLPPTEFKDYSNGTETIGRFLSNGILLNSVNLKWSDEYQAFHSVGKIGIASIMGEEIDAKVEGYIEFPKADNNYTARIFLNTLGDKWYYFRYDKNAIFTYSNSSEYNEILNKAKGDLKQSNNIEEINTFVNSFRMNYLNEEPLMLGLPVDDLGSDGLTDEMLDEAGGFDEIGEPLEDTPPPASQEDEEDDDDGF